MSSNLELYAALLVASLAAFTFYACRLRRRPRPSFLVRTRTVAYTYSATATAKISYPTHLVFPAPAAPYNRNIRPTVARDFTNELSRIGIRQVKGEEALTEPLKDRPPTRQSRATALRITLARDVSPRRNPSQGQPPITPPGAAPASSSHQQEVERPRVSAEPRLCGLSAQLPSRDFRPGSAVAGPSRREDALPASTRPVGRSRSPSVPSGSSRSSESPAPLSSHPPSSIDAAYLERYRRCPARSEVPTYWWQTQSPERIDHPPDLSRHPELKEGDVFVHRYGSFLDNGGEHQDLWICVSEHGRLRWKIVKVGYKRGDGRVLTLTEAHKVPSWLDRDWYLKRLAQARV